MISKGFYEELEVIANERHLDLQDVFKSVETALIKACQLEGAKGEINIEFNEEQKKIRVFQTFHVVEEIDPEGPEGQILLDEAKEMRARVKSGQDFRIEISIGSIGRKGATRFKQIFIRRRIINRIIDPVDDTEQRILTAAQQSIQMLAEIFVLNLLRIRPAYRGNVIRINDSAFHKVHGIVEFQISVIEVFPIQPQHIIHDFFREYALIFQVMDGIKRTNVPVTPIPAMLQFQEHVNQSRMPVIRMDNIRPEIHDGKQIQNSTAEERKPFRIIVITVKSLTVKILLIIHKIVGDTVPFVLIQPDVLHTPGHRDLAVIDMFHGITVRRIDFAKLRQDDPDIDSFLLQCLRQ